MNVTAGFDRQAKEGAQLSFVREDCADGAICEAHCAGETIAQFRVWFSEGEKGQ